MNHYLFFEEYPENTVPVSPKYEQLLKEHLFAGRTDPDIEEWKLTCSIDDDYYQKLISVCEFSDTETEQYYNKRFERFLSSLTEIRPEAFISVSEIEPETEWDLLFVPFGRIAEMIAADHSLSCDPAWFLLPVESYVRELTAKLFQTLRAYYRSRIAEETSPDSTSGETAAETDFSGSFASWMITDGYRSAFTEAPVLFRLIVEGIDRICSNLRCLLSRLAEDRQDIEKTFGIGSGISLTGILTGISDRHRQGQTVAVLSFENGRKIVYKPRDLSADVFWQDLTENLNAAFASELFRTPLVLPKEGYGYTEYVEYEPAMSADELETYFYRCGALLSIVSVLGGSDFHHENLIVSGGSPVLVDLETLVTCWSKWHISGDISTSENRNPPVLAPSRTLLLSKWAGKTIDGAVNIGAFCGANPGKKNFPVDADGSPVTCDSYPEEFIRGFREVNCFIMQNRESFLNWLRPVSEISFRFVLRNTRVYSELLNYFTGIRGLKDGSAYECVTSRVYAAYILSGNTERLQRFLPMIREEQLALKHRDIPVFYARGTSADLYSGNGETLVKDFFECSPSDVIRQNVFAVDEDLTSREIRYIEATLKLNSMQETRRIRENWSYLDRCRRIVSGDSHISLDIICGMIRDIDQMIENNTLDEGCLLFYTPVRDMRNGRYSLEILDHTLYNGLWGVLLYLTMRNKQTTAVNSCLKKELRHLCEPGGITLLTDLSLTEGLGGLLMLIRNYIRITGDSLSEELSGLICRIRDVLPSVWESSDYFNGCAGFMYALCELFTLQKDLPPDPDTRSRQAWNDEDILAMTDVIRQLTGYLLENRNGSLWFDADTDYGPLTGLAHGQMGYALALSSALAFLEKDMRSEAEEAIRSAVRYEFDHLDTHAHNLPDFRKFHVKLRDASPDHYQKRFMYGNCSGIVGSTMGLLKVMRDLKGKDCLTQEELRVWMSEVKLFLDSDQLVGNDSLCCGTAAWLDLLCELRKDAGLRDWADGRLAAVTKTLSEQGSVFNALDKEICDISLYKGSTGIGYTLLRMTGDYPGIVI